MNMLKLDEKGKLGRYNRAQFTKLSTDLEEHCKEMLQDRLKNLDWSNYDGEKNNKHQQSVSDLFQQDKALILLDLLTERTNKNYIDQNDEDMYFTNPGERVKNIDKLKDAQIDTQSMMGDRDQEDKPSKHGEILQDLIKQLMPSRAGLDTGRLKDLVVSEKL
ncbi:unnamed protein product [Gordionus sp. m RMFG-2023]